MRREDVREVCFEEEGVAPGGFQEVLDCICDPQITGLGDWAQDCLESPRRSPESPLQVCVCGGAPVPYPELLTDHVVLGVKSRAGACPALLSASPVGECL